MDLFTQFDRYVEFTIDGKKYKAPRFLNDAMSEWAKLMRDEQIKTSTDVFGEDKERKARFLLYWPKPAVDVRDLALQALTPDGSAYVVSYCLEKAGVPAETIATICRDEDPMKLRDLADDLCTAQQIKVLTKTEGDKSNPTSGSKPSAKLGSVDVQGTTPTTTPASSTTTLGSTPPK